MPTLAPPADTPPTMFDLSQAPLLRQLTLSQQVGLLQQFALIQEADRLMQPFRTVLALQPKAHPGTERRAITPLTPSTKRNNLFYKREDQTIIRAYKVRGAFTGMKRAMETLGETRFLAVSTGNHALGMLKAAELLRPQTVQIVVPTNASEVKLRQINSKILGLRHKGVEASIISLGDTFDEARNWALEQQLTGDGTYVDPYNHPWTVAGQGTIGLELYRQLLPLLADRPEVSELVLICPIGGGGLLAGTATGLSLASAYDARFANIKLRYVGLRLQNQSTKYGDAVRVKYIAPANEATMDALAVERLKMSDEQMAHGMLGVYYDLHEKVEGPCAATWAWAQHRDDLAPTASRLVVCVMSGGNVSHFPGH